MLRSALIWGQVAADTVTVDIVTRGGKKTHKQIPVGTKDAMVIFDVLEGRRQIFLDEEMVAAAQNLNKSEWVDARNQVNDYLKAAQTKSMADDASSLANADPISKQRHANRNRRQRGAVGYRIQPTILPEGTSLSATAVVSGDRRYVRITPMPMFSSIGDVTVFDTSGRPNPTDPAVDPDNNGGGGGGGGGR